MERLKNVVEHAKENDIKIAFNPGTLELENPEELKKLLPDISILALNKDEMQLLFDGETIEELALNAAQVVGIAVVTDGPKGEAASDGTKICTGGMYEDVPVVDRLGAGDAFASGFTSAIIHGRSLEDAITLGSANSTSVVQQIGAKPGILDKDAQLHDMPIECKEVASE